MLNAIKTSHYLKVTKQVFSEMRMSITNKCCSLNYRSLKTEFQSLSKQLWYKLEKVPVHWSILNNMDNATNMTKIHVCALYTAYND